MSHKIVYMCSLVGGEEGREDQREKEGNKNGERRSLTQIKWDYDGGTGDTHGSRFLTRLCVTSRNAVLPVYLQALSLSWGNLVICGNDRVHREILIHCKSANDPCGLPRRPTTPDNIKTEENPRCTLSLGSAARQMREQAAVDAHALSQSYCIARCSVMKTNPPDD